MSLYNNVLTPDSELEVPDTELQSIEAQPGRGQAPPLHSHPELRTLNFYSIIKKAILTRKVEEKLLELFAEGLLNGTVHTCVGQELVGAVVSEHLEEADHIVSNHRGHGHYLSRFGDVKGLIAEVMGKTTGCCGGIGGSQHLINKNYLSNGIQGGMTPIATGIGLANKLKGIKAISVAFIGDGTLGEGIFYETLNIAAVWDIPVAFILENNQYAQSTSFNQTFKGDIRKRIEGFGISYYQGDTWSVDHLNHTVAEAFDVCRAQSRPVFIEINTYRLNSHSKGDDNRDTDEIIKYRNNDVISKLLHEPDEQIQALLADIQNTISEAVEFAKNSPPLVDFNSTDDVRKAVSYEPLQSVEGRCNEVLYNTFKNLFSEDERLLMIGEDIEYTTAYAPKPYGGAFKVTRDLSRLFSGRVKNTPISEAAITGIGTGLALSGFRPIVEIMFGDFTTHILDQLLQHAAKFELMFNRLVQVPLIIRTPMGGKRGYGPTHSQSIEKIFMGIPNLNVVALNHRISPELIYSNIISKTANPHLVIENKVLYTRDMNAERLKGFDYLVSDELFPTLCITPSGSVPDITIICYGELLFDVEEAVKKAFVDDEILCEVICPSLISPTNIEPVLASVSKTKRLLIVEEGTSNVSWSSEVLALLAENNAGIKKLKRLSNNNIIPCCLSAELNLIPDVSKIRMALSQLL